MVKEIYKNELQMLLSNGALLIDVREDEQVTDEGLPGHQRLPLSRIGELETRFPKRAPIVFYCRSGLMSYQAAEIAAGWTEETVYYLSGGLLGYLDA